MIRYFAFLLLACPLALAGAEDFRRADAAMRSAVDVFALAAKTRADADAEARNLASLAAAAKSHLSSLEAKAAALEKSAELSAGENSGLSDSVRRAAAELDGLSAFLDSFYAGLLAYFPKGKAPEGGAEFSQKTVQEKLRAVLSALDSLKKLDSEIYAAPGGAVSSGIFARGGGRGAAPVCVLKVEGGRGK